MTPLFSNPLIQHKSGKGGLASPSINPFLALESDQAEALAQGAHFFVAPRSAAELVPRLGAQPTEVDIQAGQVQRAGEVWRRALRPSGLPIGELAALDGLRIAAIGESGQVDLPACKGGRLPVNRIDAPAVDEEVLGIVFAVDDGL